MKLLRSIARFLVVWFIETLSLLITAWLVAGISINPSNDISPFVVAVAASLILGIVNLVIRPLLLLLAMPLGWAVLFLAGFLINGIVLMITSRLIPAFEVTGFGPAFLGGLVLAFVNMILLSLLNLDSDESFYGNLALRRAAQRAEKVEPGAGRGLLMMEIDGLSYWHIQKAVEDGYLPTLKKMIDEDGYQISRVDCGIPSTTPACQAGILQGNNIDIPAFRWLDKKTGKMMAGGQAAAKIEPELSDGKGLLRGGASISNMFSGDAEKAILTFSRLKAETPEDKKKRAEDMYLLMRNPNFFVRVLVLFFGDILQELFQGWQQRRKNVQPRINRLEKGFPLLRAAINVFLSDISAYFTALDIVRGTPAIYTLFAGYDEVAHHAGPWTKDAMLTLSRIDKIISRLLKIAEEKAPRPYEFILLSDHGQSTGASFKQRYDVDILEYVQSLLPQGVNAVGTGGGDDGTIGVSAMMGELENIEDSHVSGRVGQAAISTAQRAMQTNLNQQSSFQAVNPDKVTVCYSGNLAQVYFDLFPRRITLNELNVAYPGMVDSMVKHDGIGFVVAYEDDGDPVAFGKNGARNLHTGDVVGEDPLLPFGDVELRSWQVRRVADFQTAGDLIINSTVYPDGTVAAMEELIGNHGGMGGEQTDAFMFHPGDMEVPETRNSYEFKAIMDARRGLPGPTPKPERPTAAYVEPWSIKNMGKGLSQIATWLRLAAQAVVLNREAYREIARDTYMTAPALLISLVTQIIQSINAQGKFDIVDILVRYVLWFVSIAFLFLGARILRGNKQYTTTLRVAGFASSAHFLELLSFVPVLGPAMRFIALLLTLLGVWIGTATAHELRGWRTLLLPVVYFVTFVIGVVFLFAVIKGTGFAIQNLLADFGMTY